MEDIGDKERRTAEAAEARRARREERRARLRAGRFDTSVPSPCIAVCQMDAENRYCIGCRRSLDEIRDWMILTAEEKRAILDQVAARGAGRP